MMEIIKEQDAKNAIELKNMNASYRFCPLKNGNCNTLCVSYNPAQYIEFDNVKKEGYIAYGCCNCYMLMGGE